MSGNLADATARLAELGQLERIQKSERIPMRDGNTPLRITPPAFDRDTELSVMRDKAPWVWLQRCIDEASAALGERWKDVTPEIDEELLPMAARLPSALGIDFDFYGLTVIAGKAGTGKSLAAIACAVEAAEAGWRVVYLNTEMDIVEIKTRVRRCGVGRGGYLATACENLLMLDVPMDATMPGMIAQLRAAIRVDDRRVLLVVDSVNTFAELLVRKDYDTAALNQLSRVSVFLTRLRRISVGDIAVIAVSELAAAGNVKGRKLEYAADVVLGLEADEDDPGLVEVHLTKNRSGPRPRLGRFRIDWQHGRLVPQ